MLINPILEGKADVVYGSRFAGGGPHRVLYYWHMVGNKFLTTLSNMFTNINLTDMETCYKAFRREIIQFFKLKKIALDLSLKLQRKLLKKDAEFMKQEFPTMVECIKTARKLVDEMAFG